MVIFTDRELEFLATLKDAGERLYRAELARLLKEDAERRFRFDDQGVRSRGTGSLHKWARCSSTACSCSKHLSHDVYEDSAGSRPLHPSACDPIIKFAVRKRRQFVNAFGKPRRTNSTNLGVKTMRNILIAALVLTAAAMALPASAAQLSPGVSAGEPALQIRKGRRHLCQEHLQAQGYPHSYLHRRSSRGLVGACARKLWRQWKHPLRA